METKVEQVASTTRIHASSLGGFIALVLRARAAGNAKPENNGTGRDRKRGTRSCSVDDNDILLACGISAYVTSAVTSRPASTPF